MDGETAQQRADEWDFWMQGLDRKFFSRVYQRAGILGVVGSLFALGLEQYAVAAGLFCGAVLGLFSTWSVEATVKLLFNGGGFAGVKLAVAAMIKMPLLVGALFGIAWAGDRGLMNIFATVGGVMLVHATMGVMAIATAVANLDRVRERYR